MISKEDINIDVVSRRMLDTIRGFEHVIPGINLNEEYNGDFEKASSLIVNDQNFPGVLEQIKASITQKLPNVNLESDALTVNRSNNTITLKGTIQNFNNLGFIITTDTSSNNNSGLYITVSALNINPDVIQAITVLYGFSQIMIKEWDINRVKDTFQQAEK